MQGENKWYSDITSFLSSADIIASIFSSFYWSSFKRVKTQLLQKSSSFQLLNIILTLQQG